MPANYSVEWVEVSFNGIDIDDDASGQLRLTLVSPDGVHSELTNWERSGFKGALGTDGSVVHTFTTNRHWGERTEGVGTINPITGERIEPFEVDDYTDANGVVTAGGWQLVVENWSETAATMTGSIDFHVTPTPTLNLPGGQRLGGRIQGSIGLDINQDDDFNFTGVVAIEAMTDNTGEIYIASGLDRAYEPMVAGVKVWVDTDKDGVHDSTEKYTYTTADGNYFFDLPWNFNSTPGTQGYDYDIRFEMPTDEQGNALYDLVGEEMHTYRIGLDDGAYHIESNFIFQPKPITFEGNVFADFDLDSQYDFGEATVEQFRVFVDINENGVLDYADVDGNGVFDNGIDFPFEPMQYTAADGAYSVELTTDINVPTDFFGNQLFLNDFYVGADYYNLMVDFRDGWAPTGIDVTAVGFAGSMGATPSPGLAFHRVYAEPGRTYADMDFGVAPDSGSISGFVFNDLNRNGTRQTGEVGLAGFTVYLDADNSVQALIQGGADVTDPATYDTAEQSIVTATNGNYLFENLAAGVYDLFIIPAAGYDADDQTHPIGGFHLNRVLDAGENLGDGTNEVVNFGFYNPTAVPTAPRDYGDLGGTFLTTSASGGPSHGIVDGFHLGATVAAETDGDPGGDHLDDDGITIHDEIIAGNLVHIDVEASTNVLFLQGWMDFNANGAFDSDEHIAFRDSAGELLPFANQPRLEVGVNELSFIVPNSVMASEIAARFRYGEGGFAQFNKPNGPALLGEVEDYVFGATISSFSVEPLAGDFNGNNVVDQADYRVWKQTRGSEIDFRADGNADGRIDMADYAVWRDNLGAVAQQTQTIFAPLVAAATTDESPDTGLAFFVTEEAQPPAASLVTSSSDAQSAEAVDLYFLQTNQDDETNIVDSLVGNEDGAEDDEALLVALEEEFGSAL